MSVHSHSPAPAAKKREPDWPPADFLTARLQESGPFYWKRPRTADCVVVTPLRLSGQQLVKRRRSADIDQHARMAGTSKRGGQPDSRTDARDSMVWARRTRDSARQDDLISSSEGKTEEDGAHKDEQPATVLSNICGSGLGSAVASRGLELQSQRRQSAPLPSIRPHLPTTSDAQLVLPGGASQRCVKMSFRVHANYLMQSGLLVRLFSASDNDRLSLTAKLFSPIHANTVTETKGTDEQARILATSPTVILYLPLPDPPSFSYLLYYIYHGSVEPLLDALKAGTLRWQGVIANIDFLDLDRRIKQRVGHWWREHVNGG